MTETMTIKATIEDLKPTLTALAKIINEASEAGAKYMVGREVVLKEGKYAGRLGKIDAVACSRQHGLCYLVMVYRQGTKEFLNSDGESRSYRPLEQFEEAPDAARQQ